MRDQFGFLARAEPRSIVRLVEPAPKLGDELRSGCTASAANLRAGLAVTDRSRPLGNMTDDAYAGILALGAIARLTVGRRAGTIEHRPRSARSP